jgi:hypothetical protein
VRRNPNTPKKPAQAGMSALSRPTRAEAKKEARVKAIEEWFEQRDRLMLLVKEAANQRYESGFVNFWTNWTVALPADLTKLIARHPYLFISVAANEICREMKTKNEITNTIDLLERVLQQMTERQR